MKTKKMYLTPSVRTAELLENAHLMSVSEEGVIGGGSTGGGNTEGGDGSTDQAKLHGGDDFWKTEW